MGKGGLLGSAYLDRHCLLPRRAECDHGSHSAVQGHPSGGAVPPAGRYVTSLPVPGSASRGPGTTPRPGGPRSATMGVRDVGSANGGPGCVRHRAERSPTRPSPGQTLRHGRPLVLRTSRGLTPPLPLGGITLPQPRPHRGAHRHVIRRQPPKVWSGRPNPPWQDHALGRRHLGFCHPQTFQRQTPLIRLARALGST